MLARNTKQTLPTIHPTFTENLWCQYTVAGVVTTTRA